jgi:hypothetical protein
MTVKFFKGTGGLGTYAQRLSWVVLTAVVIGGSAKSRLVSTNRFDSTSPSRRKPLLFAERVVRLALFVGKRAGKLHLIVLQRSTLARGRRNVENRIECKQQLVISAACDGGRERQLVRFTEHT